MPNTASASDCPWTWAMPQSSRVIVTRDASARQRASSGGEAAVRRNGRRPASRALCIRQGLLGLAPTHKGLRAGPLEKLIGVADAEVVAAPITVELFPGDRRRHGGTFAGACRVRHDRGRPTLVPQPIEEDPALALDLANIRRESLRLRFGDRPAETVGETLDGRPVLRGVERSDDMDAFAARQKRKALQAEVV